MTKRIITNGHVVQDWQTILPNHDIYTEDDTIVAIGVNVEIPADADVIDARGGLVMPGCICAHTHFYGAFARGLAIPGAPPKDFPEILERLWWPLDQALDANAIRLSALVSLLDAIKHGTTTIIDHHASPNAINGSLDIIADAVELAGLRAVLCYEVTDRGGVEKAEAGIAENVRFLEAAKSRRNVAGTFGLHASFTLSDETLAKCVAAVGGAVGFHIHVAEHEDDEYDSMLRTDMRVVNRLENAGILGNKTIIAHAVHCDPWELALLNEYDCWVTHQPRSNMNNGVGAAAIDAMLSTDMRLCLGNDGFSNNMWSDWKAAYLLQKVVHRDPRRGSGDGIARMAMDNNARLAEVFFPTQKIGTLEPGAVADMIIVDYHPFTPLTGDNLPWHILFGFESSMVRTTIASGEVLMHDRQVLALDEAAIVAEALEAVPHIWERYRTFATTKDIKS